MPRGEKQLGRRGWVHAASILPGSVLLAAALLKLHTVATEGAKASQAVLLGGMVLVESLLGSWLLVLPANFWLVGASCALFLGFAGYHGYAIVRDLPPCLCFGSVTVLHEIALGLSLLCGALLGAVLVAGAAARGSEPDRRMVGRVGLAAAAATVVLGAVLVVADRLPVVARLRGQAVRISAASLRPAPVIAGQWTQVPVRVTNKWDRPVTLVGGSFSCTCHAVDDLPLTLAPGETKTLRTTISPIGRPGHHAIRLVLFTDVPWQWQLEGALHLIVQEPRRRAMSAGRRGTERDVTRNVFSP
jgi:hypothetical protein